jgi:hypothetical protein
LPGVWRLTDREPPNVLEEALSAVRGIANLLERAEALADVALRLPEEERQEVLDQALSAAPAIGDAQVRARRLDETVKT